METNLLTWLALGIYKIFRPKATKGVTSAAIIQNTMAIPLGGYSTASQAAAQKQLEYMNTNNMMNWLKSNWIFLVVGYFLLTRKKLF
jgi:hypothetical protein